MKNAHRKFLRGKNKQQRKFSHSEALTVKTTANPAMLEENKNVEYSTSLDLRRANTQTLRRDMLVTEGKKV